MANNIIKLKETKVNDKDYIDYLEIQILGIIYSIKNNKSLSEKEFTKLSELIDNNRIHRELLKREEL